MAPPALEDGATTTVLGDWYATVLRWRPQVALFVNEDTLLPVLMPLAPSRTMIGRFPGALADVLVAHGMHQDFIDAECAEMTNYAVAPTRSRSVVGTMNDFTVLAGVWRPGELLGLSVRLAQAPCSPLYQRHITPQDELRALIADRR